MFFKLPVLTLSNLVWVLFPAILFNETYRVVKTSKGGHVPVCYEVINLFIRPQNFLLIVCDGLLMLFLYFVYKLLPNMTKQHIAAISSEVFCLWLLA